MDSIEKKNKPEPKSNHGINSNIDIEEEEDASTLQFPKEFQNAEPLFISEVLLLLQHHKKNREKDEDGSELSRVFHSTLNYATKFATFKHRVIIKEVRNLIMSRRLKVARDSEISSGEGGAGGSGESEVEGEFAKLHKFEVACLANLTPDNGDETCALIRSLARFNPADLDQLCDDIKTQKSFQATSVDIDDAMD